MYNFFTRRIYLRGQPNFYKILKSSSQFSQSKALLKSMNAMCKFCCSSLDFFISCRKVNIPSIVLLLLLYPDCDIEYSFFASICSCCNRMSINKTSAISLQSSLAINLNVPISNSKKTKPLISHNDSCYPMLTLQRIPDIHLLC